MVEFDMSTQPTDPSRRRKLSPLRQFLRRLSKSFTRDDLLLRVIFFMGGACFAGLGVAMSLWGVTHNLWALTFGHLFYWTTAIIFTAYGGLLFSRCVLAARSRSARFVERFLPDAVGLEDGLALLLLMYLPAVLLTIVLRNLGIKGQRMERNRELLPQFATPIKKQTNAVRNLTDAEKNVILDIARRLPTGKMRDQLLSDVANVTAYNEDTVGASRVLFNISGYQRPPYRGQHSFGVAGRMADRDGAQIDLDLYADENDRLLELEFIRQGSGPIQAPNWSSLVLF